MLASAPGGMKGKMTGFADFDMQLLGPAELTAKKL